MKYLILGLVLLSVLILNGCSYMAPVMPPQGALYASFKAPLDTNVENTDMGTKTGEAQSVSILGLISYGDCSVNSAAKNGGLTKINHADYEFFNVLYIYQSFKTIAYGD